MALRLRRGTDAQRLTVTPSEGELVYATDTKRLWIGDGTTVGGILVNTGGAYSLDSLVDVDTTTITPEVGDVLKFDGTNFIPATEGAFTEGGNYYINIVDDQGDSLLDADGRYYTGSVRALDGVAILVDADNGRMYGEFFGNITGDVTGDVFGDVNGSVTGDLTGNVSGNVTGNVTGDLTGNIYSAYGRLLVNGNNDEHYGTFKGSVVGEDSTTLVDGVNRIIGNGVVTINNDEITCSLGPVTINGTFGSVGPSLVCTNTFNDPGVRVESVSNGINGPHMVLYANSGSLINTLPIGVGDSAGSLRFNALAVTPVGNIPATLGVINVSMTAESDGVSTAPAANMEFTMPNGPNPAGYKKATFSTAGVFTAPVFKATGYATGSLPTSPEEGWIVFDSTTKEFKGWNGTSWAVLG